MMNTTATAEHAVTDIASQQPLPDAQSTIAHTGANDSVRQGVLYVSLVVTTSALLGAACGWLVAMLLSSPG